MQIGDHVGALAVLWMPAKPIAVPGTKPFGLVMNLLRSSIGPGAALGLHGGREIEAAAALALLVADDAVEIRDRRGWGRPSRRCGRRRTSWRRRRPSRPRRSAAVSRSARTGRGRGFLGPASASSFTAISKPGFSGITGAKIAPAVKLVTSRTRQVPRMAPRILLSSKESILDQAPGRKVDFRPARRPRMSIRNQAFAPHPKHRSDIGLPVLWQPV